MKILAIETSCDETGVAILECEGSFEGASFTILGNALYSQATLHAPYGGVYPNLAKREHQNNLAPLATEALKASGLWKSRTKDTPVNDSSFENIRDQTFKSNIEDFLASTEKPDIAFIAVTKGPGLEPALWTGINFAESLGRAWNIPVIGIDHMEGHIFSALLKQEVDSQQSAEQSEALLNPKRYTLNAIHFPILAFLISGGHTEFVVMKEPFVYEHIGATRDDAIGEAFDKVARLLDLPYPGGPQIAEVASRSRARGEKNEISFPRPMAQDDTCDFSFSGLKTAVLYKLRDMDKIDDKVKEQIAEAFEDAARDVVIIKTKRALEATEPKILAVGGGVSANTEIKRALTALIDEEFSDIQLLFPDATLTGDNAIMIGVAGYLRHLSGTHTASNLSALGNLKLGE
ncbi:MAG: tRNA (adenosine(37)-N6)-threonylcarbamoyltransferase complex transferase subunit TsaD [Candidatus Pacebacteria bacterium]|nr:tRNA (adenosine(37)-N6)-threonylcarbamoyltransferase complex transferase subunit TsaD [Candidatus Paceibacterota bacterium]